VITDEKRITESQEFVIENEKCPQDINKFLKQECKCKALRIEGTLNIQLIRYILASVPSIKELELVTCGEIPEIKKPKEEEEKLEEDIEMPQEPDKYIIAPNLIAISLKVVNMHQAVIDFLS